MLASTVRAHPEHPGLQVLGEMLLRGDDGRTGYARVDYFTPKGLGSWGDVRFTVVGTTGYIEVSPAEDAARARRRRLTRASIECQGGRSTGPRQFLAGDDADRQDHVFAVHDVCLRAAQGMSTTRPTA